MVKWLIGIMLLAGFFSSARAQDSSDENNGIDAHGFTVAAQDGDPRDPLRFMRPGIMHSGEWYVGLAGEYARKLMMQGATASDGSSTEVAVVDHLVALNLGLGWVVHPVLRLDVSAPLYLRATTPDGTAPVQLGDTSLSGLVSFIQPKKPRLGWGLAVRPWVIFPTGKSSDNLGLAGVGVGTEVLATGEIGRLTLSGQVGLQAAPYASANNLPGGTSLLTGLGVGVLLTDDLGLTLEYNRKTALSSSSEPGSASPNELVLSHKGRIQNGFHWMVAGAMGLGSGVGASEYRVYGGLGYSHLKHRPQTTKRCKGTIDQDGNCLAQPKVTPDVGDTCPDDAASLTVRTAFMAQALDLPLLITGVDNQYNTTSGESLDCLPPGLYDIRTTARAYEGSVQLMLNSGNHPVDLDVYPAPTAMVSVIAKQASGEKVSFANMSLSPVDSEELLEATAFDGETTFDLTPGEWDLVVQADKYNPYQERFTLEGLEDTVLTATLSPIQASTQGEQPKLTEVVPFAPGSATLSQQSDATLTQVATVLINHPKLTRVQVTGHTDNQGPPTAKQQLSQQRAQAVVDVLVAKGVAPERLIAVGYGDTLPTQSNDTEAGRASNNRVEFVIAE